MTTRRSTIGLSLFALLLALGCAAKSSHRMTMADASAPGGSAAPMESADYGDYAEDTYDFAPDEDDYEAEPAPVTAPAPPPADVMQNAKQSGKGMGMKEKKVARPIEERRDLPRNETASPKPTKSKPTTEAKDGKAEPAVEEPDDDAGGRYVIYTASMTIGVFDLDKSMRAAEALIETHDGYISMMNRTRIVLRVPAGKLKQAMDDLAEFGVVEQRTLQAQEVTAEFVDIQSRIRALEETQKQLLELLSKARSVSEALEVRRALDNINSQLEVLKGRLRHLGNLIAFSTLTIDFNERSPYDTLPSSNDPFPWVDQLGVEATEWK